MRSLGLWQNKDNRMRIRYWLAAIPLLLVGTAHAGVLVPGFRDMQWGDPVSKLGTASKALPKIKPGHDDCFARPTDKLFINDIPLTEIRYCFKHGKMASVMVEFDKKLAAKVKNAVSAGYGAPSLDAGTFVNWGDDKQAGDGTVFILGPDLVFASNDASHESKVDEVVKARKDF
jgi:hypothetical protein